ncbi:uncharacterized protein B0H64DRAFT_215968 [Chaetomium fimeti]|uniref:Uncharacterized protein n=1 Tax=Chaetomium fimeti TaxID=1854472 RepID=A0AAE0HBK1_9PEZI|nr:hypothetical protein B0H64DRAFT_215968 [Chaetomium fimeti]
MKIPSAFQESRSPNKTFPTTLASPQVHIISNFNEYTKFKRCLLRRTGLAQRSSSLASTGNVEVRVPQPACQVLTSGERHCSNLRDAYFGCLRRLLECNNYMITRHRHEHLSSNRLSWHCSMRSSPPGTRCQVRTPCRSPPFAFQSWMRLFLAMPAGPPSSFRKMGSLDPIARSPRRPNCPPSKSGIPGSQNPRRSSTQRGRSIQATTQGVTLSPSPGLH